MTTPFSTGPLEQYSEPHSDQQNENLLANEHPCSACHTPAILSDENLCCGCTQEARLTSALFESRPVYILCPNLSYHRVIALFHTNIPHQYSVIVPDISSRLTCDITDFHLSIPSLVTTGIARANDAILRFNHLHKQHLSLA